MDFVSAKLFFSPSDSHRLSVLSRPFGLGCLLPRDVVYQALWSGVLLALPRSCCTLFPSRAPYFACSHLAFREAYRRSHETVDTWPIRLIPFLPPVPSDYPFFSPPLLLSLFFFCSAASFGERTRLSTAVIVSSYVGGGGADGRVV